MSVFIPYSQREKDRQNAGNVDVYQYDNLSSSFRSQIAHIWRDVIGDTSADLYVWNALASQIGRTVGAIDLYSKAQSDAKTRGVPFDHVSYIQGVPVGSDKMKEQCILFLLNAGDVSVLDAIEISIYVCLNRNKFETDISRLLSSEAPKTSLQEAIDEINYRFKQNSLGYVIEQYQLIRIDSEIIHKNAVVPALTLIHQPEFKSANDEYRRAHDLYRNGNYPSAIGMASNAFESTMKIIAKERNWVLPNLQTTGPLIDMCFANGLVPEQLDEQKEGVRAMLRGLSVIRNTSGGHGSGGSGIPVHVPEQLAAYALNLAASNIVFLVRQHNEMPK